MNRYIAELEQDNSDCFNWMEYYKSFGKLEELTRFAAAIAINRILIYEDRRHQNYFQFRGIFQTGKRNDRKYQTAGGYIMARKKRLNADAIIGNQGSCALGQGETKNHRGGIYQTAAYIRLSTEDSGKKDGYSLQNQEMLVLDYIGRHLELNLYRE